MVASASSLKPLNVWSKSEDEIGRAMSNFAETPFELDGVRYASVEGFYVSLLFLEDEKRALAAKLSGAGAKNLGKRSKLAVTCYRGEWIELGSPAHHVLVKRAIRAKLLAHPLLAAEFAATAPRPIFHETSRPDRVGSRFPKEVFVRILTELREEFAGATIAGRR